MNNKSLGREDNQPVLLQPVDEVTYTPKSKRLAFTREKVIAFVVLITGVLLLIIGIALIATAERQKATCSKDDSQTTKKSCLLSEEAKRVGLGEFIDRVKATYFKLHPYEIFHDPDIENDPDEGAYRMRTQFAAYDPTPSAIKMRTDTSFRLLKEIQEKKIDADQLKPRERKTLAQVKHFLNNLFGHPYDANFYTGDWMMGPTSFCWQPVCSISYNIYNMLLFNEPSSLYDVGFILKTIEDHQDVFDHFVANMKLGIQKGMVRSVEQCKAGYDAISRRYLNVSLHNETGVLKEWYTQRVMSKEFYSDLPEEANTKWEQMHNKNVSESIKEYLVDYIGKPIVRMLRYLKEEHLPHCVPSSVSSGLGRLPVKYVYTNGVANKSQPTDPTLPLTDRILDGKKSYEMILSYFTTINMTADEVHQLGWDMLNKLYPKIVEIAKQITKIDNDTAVTEFRKILNKSESYFNAETIPQNESNENAHRLCSDLKGAKKHCPKRWEAIQLWFKEARKVMSMLDPKIVNMFYFTGSKHTTPNCPIDLKPDLNPSSGAQSYEASNSWCGHSSIYFIPFFLEKMGPRYSEWSVNAHEARPGHHLQVQGNVENFQDKCVDSIGWLDTETYYTAFTEGWALYAENPLIAEDTNTYANEPMQKFGMLKWQIWRAIRLIVDTGMHYKGMSRAEALKILEEKAWDGTDLAEKEITRYQSNPGQATAYMIGQIDIKNGREYVSSNLKKDFDLKDFHYQVLSQGSSPLGFLSDHIRRYVACKKDPKKSGCAEILYSSKKTSKQTKALKKKSRLPLRPPKRHYI